MIISWVRDFVIWIAIKINNEFMPKKLLTFIISKSVDIFNKLIFISLVLSTVLYIKLPAHHHVQPSLQHWSSVECVASAPVLVFPSECGLPTIYINKINMARISDVPESAISGLQVVESIIINHNEAPQQRATEG
eukprot:5925310-Amphidinium_carterae.1